MQAASASAVEALLALAEELAGSPVASAKCLEAVLQRATSLLPLTEVHARLRLALLLLEHTDNVQAARMHLERGVRGLAARPLSSASLPRSKCCSPLSPPATTSSAASSPRSRAATRWLARARRRSWGRSAAAASSQLPTASAWPPHTGARRARSPAAPHAARSPLWTGWALHFGLQACTAHLREGELAAASDCLRAAREVALEAHDTAAEARWRVRPAAGRA